jgi:hypothetical protein
MVNNKFKDGIQQKKQNNQNAEQLMGMYYLIFNLCIYIQKIVTMTKRNF